MCMIITNVYKGNHHLQPPNHHTHHFNRSWMKGSRHLESQKTWNLATLGGFCQETLLRGVFHLQKVTKLGTGATNNKVRIKIQFISKDYWAVNMGIMGIQLKSFPTLIIRHLLLSIWCHNCKDPKQIPSLPVLPDLGKFPNSGVFKCPFEEKFSSGVI